MGQYVGLVPTLSVMDDYGEDPRGPDTGALFVTDLYMAAGEEALLGGFRGGSPEVRSTILERFSNRPLPNELLKEAVQSNDAQVLWALAQRTDLPDSVVHQLVKSDSPLVRTHMAGHPQVTAEHMAPLMPGSPSIRSRLFMHPAAPRSLRYGIATTTTGKYMSAALQNMLNSPEYALWSLESLDHTVVSNGVDLLAKLPPAWQWDAAVLLAETRKFPLAELFTLTGWTPSLHRLIAEAESAERLYGTPSAAGLLLKRLRDQGRPEATELQEALLLPDPEDADLLNADDLSWGDLEAAARSKAMSLAAVRHLLRRPDRPVSFVSAAVVRYGDVPGLLRSLSIEELNATVAVSVLTPEVRGTLLRVLLKDRPTGSAVIDAVSGFPVEDVFAAIEAEDPSITAALRRAVAQELQERLGSGPEVWARFEHARSVRPSTRLGDVIAAATAPRP